MAIIQVLKRLADRSLELMISDRQRVRIARRLLNRARGENNGDPDTNGEYRLLHAVQRRLANPDAVFFDVGAHQGKWTIRAAGGAAPTVRVLAFEPSRETFATLQTATSGLPADVRLFNAALSDRDGVGALYRTGAGAGSQSLHCRDGGPSGVKSCGVEQVALREGDGVCAEHGIEHITFIKIDTEGHELAVLRGFERMMNEGRIDCLQFEYGGTWIDSRTFLADAYDWLTSREYQVARLYPDGVRRPEQYAASDENFCYSNYVAAKPDVMRALAGL